MFRAVVTLGVWAVLAGGAQAGGIFVPGVGPQAQARAGAFAAKADDPTAMAHNPAGIAKQSGTAVYLGSNFITMDLAFTRAGAYERTGELLSHEGIDYPRVENRANPSLGVGPFQALPIFAVVTDLGMPALPVRFSVGLFTPQGYSGRDFDKNVTLEGGVVAPGPQRYDVFEQSGKIAYPSVAVAYSPLPNLHVGVRGSWGFSTIETKKIVWAIRNYEEYEEKDSVTTIEAKDSFVPTWGVGALYQPTPSFEIGVAYASRSELRNKGTVNSQAGTAVPGDQATLLPENEFINCAPGGVEGALKICVNFDLPQTATVGGRWILRDGTGAEKADVELDVKWENWGDAQITETITDGFSVAAGPLDRARIPHGYQDVYSVRLGGSYTLPIRRADRLQLRAGAAYDTAAAPLSWTRLDQDGKERTTLAVGGAWDTGRWRFELGGGIVLEPDRTVEHDCQNPNGPTPTSIGCDGSGVETPVKEREAPDPAQPLQGTFNQVESPFNQGLHESSYLLFHLAATARF